MLVQLGLIELVEDCGGELRCAVTELGAAVGTAELTNDDMREMP